MKAGVYDLTIRGKWNFTRSFNSLKQGETLTEQIDFLKGFVGELESKIDKHLKGLGAAALFNRVPDGGKSKNHNLMS